MKVIKGNMLYKKLVHCDHWKTATKAPINIRNIVPGPSTVPISKIN